jgi:hypothetical protein
MTSRSLLTIIAVVAVLYGLAFLLIPDSINALYGVPSEPHVALYTRFFGSALLGLGVIDWFAKDFRSWDAIRRNFDRLRCDDSRWRSDCPLRCAVRAVERDDLDVGSRVRAALRGGGLLPFTGREESIPDRSFDALIIWCRA